MTPKQASRALAALTGLQYRAEFSDSEPYIWEKEALFRLRVLLISMLPENDPQLDICRHGLSPADSCFECFPTEEVGLEGDT